MLKWRTFPNAQHSQMQPCQMPRFAKCSSMPERCWIRTPTCELTAAKLRKGLKLKGEATEHLLCSNFNATLEGPCYACKGFNSQVPTVSTSSMLQVPNKSLPTASIRKCQEAYKTASNSQVPHKGLETASIHKCQETCKMLQPTIACKLLPLTGAE